MANLQAPLQRGGQLLLGAELGPHAVEGRLRQRRRLRVRPRLGLLRGGGRGLLLVQLRRPRQPKQSR